MSLSQDKPAIARRRDTDRNTGRVLTSQTIGVEFASKIVKCGTPPRRKRIKLQLWDTAGTERFRSVSRSYYRGAAGAILVYDIASHATFDALPTFLMDARALASPNLTLLLAGNKNDLGEEDALPRDDEQSLSSSAKSGQSWALESGTASVRSTTSYGIGGTRLTASTAPEGREVSSDEASRWASKSNIPVAVEVSALSGENVEEVFSRLARIILTKIELGEIDPDDPQSGIQYGDAGSWGDGQSIKSGMSIDDGTSVRRRGRRRAGTRGWAGEWEDVFRLGGSSSRRRGNNCC